MVSAGDPPEVGAVARGNHVVAADPEHWSEALGASPNPRLP
jgi:hypothetical protein